MTMNGFHLTSKELKISVNHQLNNYTTMKMHQLKHQILMDANIKNPIFHSKLQARQI